MPNSEHYGSRRRTANPRAKSRRVQPLSVDKLDHLPAQQREFWVEMAKFFRSDEFTVIALSAYSPFLAGHRPDVLSHTQFDIRFELLRDTTSYGIGPHSDHPNKVMTLLFYLSAGEVTESLGTSFYEPKQWIRMSVRPALSRRGFSPPQHLSICSQYCAVVFENQFILPWCRDYYGSSSERNILRWTLWKVSRARSSRPCMYHLRFGLMVNKLTQPLVLITQIQRSGGTLLSQLLDGHPQVCAHPHELHIGKPMKWDWPMLDMRSPESWFSYLYEKRLESFYHNGYVKPGSNPHKKEVLPFNFDAELQRHVFLDLLDNPRLNYSEMY